MQGKLVIVDNASVRLLWDEGLKCVQIGWDGSYVSGPEYRATLLELLDLLAMRRGCRMLFDMRNLPVVSPEDQAWIQEEWMPRSLKVGLRYSAVVMPKSALSRLTLRHIAKDASGIERQRAYFETLEEARAWLKSMPGTT